MNVWRIHIKPAVVEGKAEDAQKYCIENKVAGLGWSLNDNQIDNSDHLSIEKKNEMKTKRQTIETTSDFNVYKELINEIWGKVSPCISNMVNVEVDDLIWMRKNGIYYIGRVIEKWKYIPSNELLQLDLCNQVKVDKWYVIGDESDVPGKVANAFIPKKTFQRINGVNEICQLLYNEASKNNYYEKIELSDDKDSLFSYMTDDDFEDLLCLYLHTNGNYMVVPSSNKKGTPMYECVMINKKDGTRGYVQAKNGKVHLDSHDYEDLLLKYSDSKVYLSSTKGTVTIHDSAHFIEIKPDTIYSFVKGDKVADFLLPNSVLKWLNYVNKNERCK